LTGTDPKGLFCGTGACVVAVSGLINTIGGIVILDAASDVSSSDPWDGYDPSRPSDFDEDVGRDCDGNCRECVPPKGTICYAQTHTGHKHPAKTGIDPHIPIYIMTQDSNCVCRWKPHKKGIGKQFNGVVETRPAGVMPCPFSKG
jgi:hypothetical protein